MLNYEEFKEVVKERMERVFPAPYVIRYDKIVKINRILDSISILENSGRNCGPTLYLNDLYDIYKENGNLEEYMVDLVKKIKLAVQTNIDLDLSKAKDNIICQVVNTEQNKEMLANVPHREILDLSIIYRWVVSNRENGVSSCIVKKQLADQLGLTEEQLYDLAWKNTKRLYPPVVESLMEVILGFYKEFMSEEMLENVASKMEEELGMELDVPMYVISNKQRWNGDIYMTDTDVLFNLAEKLDSDLFILPSSIHECIAVPTSEGVNLNSLLEMVCEVNFSQAKEEERLSNNVYYFDRNSKELRIAS